MKKIAIAVLAVAAVTLAFAAPVFADPNPNACYGQAVKAFNDPETKTDSLGSKRSDKEWRLATWGTEKMSEIVAQAKANLGKPNPAP